MLVYRAESVLSLKQKKGARYHKQNKREKEKSSDALEAKTVEVIRSRGCHTNLTPPMLYL